MTKTTEAKEKTEQAEKDEKSDLAEIEDLMNESLNGIKVEKVTDQNPGVLEMEENAENTYLINSIEDLIFFAYDVTNGNNYEGKTVKLGLSLDFNSSKSYVDPFRTDYEKYGYNGSLKESINENGFIPIGKVVQDKSKGEKTNLFSGIFDGNYNVIYNMKISEDINITNQYYGIAMFSYNYGEIKNLGLENANVTINSNADKYGNIAILVGRNLGDISNCYTSGKVIGISSNYSINIGGIVGANEGIVKEAYNKTNIELVYEENDNIYQEVGYRAGGIAGVNEENGKIENVYNIGEIINKIAEENINVTPCLGGILGSNIGSIKNVYSIGCVKISIADGKKSWIGSIVGLREQSHKEENCHYLENTVQVSNEENVLCIVGEEKTSEQMKKSEFLEELNNGNETNIWKIEANMNNGYPVLYWQ